MNLKIEKLAENYRHPMKFTMGGYWGLFEGERLVVVDRSFEVIHNLKKELDEAQCSN